MATYPHEIATDRPCPVCDHPLFPREVEVELVDGDGLRPYTGSRYATAIRWECPGCGWARTETDG